MKINVALGGRFKSSFWCLVVVIYSLLFFDITTLASSVNPTDPVDGELLTIINSKCEYNSSHADNDFIIEGNHAVSLASADKKELNLKLNEFKKNTGINLYLLIPTPYIPNLGEPEELTKKLLNDFTHEALTKSCLSNANTLSILLTIDSYWDVKGNSSNVSDIKFYSYAIVNSGNTGGKRDEVVKILREVSRSKGQVLNSDPHNHTKQYVNDVIQRLTYPKYLDFEKILSEVLAENGETGSCAVKGLTEAKSDYNLHHNFDRAAYIAFVQSGLCLTTEEKCANETYWVQFNYGVTNAVIEQLDLVGVIDGLISIGNGAEAFAINQAKNRFECYLKGGAANAVANAPTSGEGLRMLTKCVLGVDMTPEEWQAVYSKLENYIKKNWNAPYIHGKATVFVLTLGIPIGKIVGFSKVKLLEKLRSIDKFSSKITELEKISKIADEGGDLAKVVDELMLANRAGKSLAELKGSVNEWVRLQRKLANSNTELREFNTATIVYDKVTQKYYYGANKGIFIKGDKIHPDLVKKLPEVSANNFKLGNCAECDAVNQALHAGSDWTDLQMHTVGVEFKTGNTFSKPLCLNCEMTFKGLDIIQ